VSASCFYEGTIRHRRFSPRREFCHPIALAYVDLEELPGLLGGRLLSGRPGLLRFRRRDYYGEPRMALDVAIRDAVQTATGSRPQGPVRALTQLRCFGHCFNPVSFYYCLAAGTGQIEAIVAEVTNTPWGERHAYALSAPTGGSGVFRASFQKALHVSPFMGMDHLYEARATVPGETLSVHVESRRDGQLAFDATLALSRRELTPGSVRRISLRYPFATIRVLALIYAHAVGLKLAGAPVHPHPGAGQA
jgi:uncharacterized protein